MLDKTSKEPVCPRVELLLKIIIILLIIFLGFIKLGQDPCPCAFDIVDMVPYTISKLSAKSQFCAIQTADNTDGKVKI